MVKGLLQICIFFALSITLNSHYLSIRQLECRNQTGVHQVAIHQDHAGTAASLSAAFFGAGESQIDP